ncbi:MAG: calcium/sodium antiporter [Bacillota bacterium]
MILLQTVLFVGGLLIVILGADWFTDAAVWFARRTGIPKVLIGATVVSIATTLPEFAVSVSASLTGHPDVALGNAVGSVTANSGLIAALSLISGRQVPEVSVFLSSGVLMLLSGVAVAVLALDGAVARVEGLLLFMLLALYIIRAVRSARATSTGSATKTSGSAMPAVVKFMLGSVLIALGSRGMVMGGVDLAKVLGIPEMVVGLTMMAVGTSIPELVTALASLLKGHQDLSLGNILGANFLNMTWVLGGSAIFGRVTAQALAITRDIPVMLCFMGALVVFGVFGRGVGRAGGVLLIGSYALYVLSLF